MRNGYIVNTAKISVIWQRGKNGLPGTLNEPDRAKFPEHGSRWEVDECGALIQDKCLKTIRGIHREVLKTGNFRERLEIEKFAIISENARRRKHCVELATLIKELNITSEQLDGDSWLLNCRNGTVNFLTGEFTEHKQKDFFTKMANVDYDPKAEKW